MSEAKRLADAKRTLHERLSRIVEVEGARLPGAIADTFAEDIEAFGAHPIPALEGRDALLDGLFGPLRAAMPDVERRDGLVAAGRHEGRDLVACLGHYQGTFVRDAWGIPATSGLVQLRYGEVHALLGDRIDRSYVLFDFLDLMRQADCWPIAPSLGVEAGWPDPRGGYSLASADPGEGERSLGIVRCMHAALADYDGKSLRSMAHAHYWHPNFMWYGPAGIGTTRGLEAFEAHHQIPFLRAFPDRRGGQHIARIGDGAFAVTAGWPSMTATHTGSGWLCLPATQRRVALRVMDFYRVEQGRIAENWVPIDILDVLRQLGLDVFARLRHRRGQPDRDV